MQIFSWIGYVFGYILWFFYEITRNYGIAIVLFTIVLKIITFPLSIKQQKSMAQNARLAGKQKELQAKYGNDKAKLSEEMQKLYAKENVNPMGGCLSMILPLILLMGVYYAVINPLTNTLHLDGNQVREATVMLAQIPGGIGGYNSFYGELEIVKHFAELKNFLPFTGDPLSSVEFFSTGFNFLGLNLLGTPNSSPFSSMLWLIPVLCLVSSLGTQFLTMRIQGNSANMQGCMKWMMYLMPVISAIFALQVPAAVGFYWIVSTLFSFLQTLVLNHFYNVNIMTAKQEAARVALREQEEARMRPVSYYNPKKLGVRSGAAQSGNAKQRQNKGGSAASKKNASKKKNSGNSGSYMGTSKRDK